MHFARTHRRVCFYNLGHAYWSEVFEHNPKIARAPVEGVDLMKQGGGARPYIERKTSKQWYWLPYRPIPGEFYFSAEEIEFGRRFRGRFILEPNVKNVGHKNKDWGMVRWVELAKRLKGLPLAQLVAPGAATIPGVEQIGTASFRLAAAVLASARGAVLPEGGLHHAAAAVGLSSVVIYSGFIGPGVTGYGLHRNLYFGEGLGCGMRVNCPHCRQALARITPELVAHEARRLLEWPASPATQPPIAEQPSS